MAVTLIVEDGSVVSGANAFASLVDVAALLAAHPFADAWALEPNQGACVAEATAWLSRLRWQGRAAFPTTQALSWPRYWVPVPDRDEGLSAFQLYDQFYLPGTAIPAFLKRATARLALFLSRLGDTPYDPTGLVKDSALRIGALSLDPSQPGSLPVDVLQEILPFLRAVGVTAVRA